ncbi:MAG: hypothetical protein ABEJ74_05100 [Haloferacaceae archaeon]
MIVSVTLTQLALPGLCAAALFVAALLYLQRPAVTHGTVVAWLPWLVAGGVLHALRGVVGYPAVVASVFELPWVYLLTATVGGFGWTLITQFASSRGAREFVPHYFGLMGVGLLLAPGVLLIVSAGAASPQTLFVWALVPVVAGILTYLTLIALGLWMPSPTYFAGSAGAAVVYGVALNGIVAALAIGVGGQAAPPWLVVLASAVARLDPVTYPLALVSGAVWVRLALGIAAIRLLAALGRSHDALAQRGLDLAIVASVVLSANAFLLGFVGGWVG